MIKTKTFEVRDSMTMIALLMALSAYLAHTIYEAAKADQDLLQAKVKERIKK